MGKKSKKSKPKAGQKGGGAAPAPAAAAAGVAGPQQSTPQPSTPTPPPDASCWICLDGDLDEGGNPIVRDCSCRGDDAGFAHISCLVNYARGKTLEMMDAPTHPDQNYNEPWTTCPNCRREYQRRVAIDMANALLSFMDEKYPGDELTKVHALHIIVAAVMFTDYRTSPELRAEGTRAAGNVISILLESGANGRPEYFEYQLGAHIALAKLAEAEGTETGYETALDWYTKALDCARSSDCAGTAVTALESNIKKVKSLRDGKGERPFMDEELQMIRAQYEKRVREEGEDHSETIYNGITLLQGLCNLGEHGLECERLASKLTAISRRVNGPDHHLTKQAELGAKRSSLRRIAKVRGSTAVMYEVLRISDDGRKYVVREMLSPDPDEGSIAEIAFDEAYMMVTGTPVVCQGLKRAAHLNGKLGDVRSFVKDAGRYAVRFEDRSLGTVSVRPVNLRIIFELPEER